ncbi:MULTISPECIES: EF-P beta-lysylation protein EpmB [unclassified Oceanobacter]|uniref:EF-P beta-lysylation protein EpmB n=1 Tax=unclassified Oceanobacter TaxID=2620260 RepID=UPI00273402E3|nr:MULTISPECIES: EF-P beta-lysylation protein EpmB [unclassified Oceanobacter]MDP2506008.1 EF-P beta-lysylation protein EpmB [Oceanobacter sp. 3_MG-2023]MDP2608961.1 EF-P beta-lysylation protein EpmB [Oceanobacter sp. 1_MG-2023]MDP2612054.1 EF-P beta-lysylation protein EpmB [Oceanobacter sp. 2_MG-2023]
MHIITRSAAIEQQDWQQILASAIRSPEQLFSALHLAPTHLSDRQLAASTFPVLVPAPYLQKMEPGNPHDPLLRQVLPDAEELIAMPGYVSDPLDEQHANITPGIVHKYQGRLLLLAATGCAVNCRYCFRRHFDYADNRLSRRQWQSALDYVRDDPSISEVILSGGDPLMLKDEALAELVDTIGQIPHVRRLRIHTRLPVVIPQRLTPALAQLLGHSRLSISVVLHINHANEIDELFRQHLQTLRQAGITLLNQSVLLQGVNNQAATLIELSQSLFDAGILPYYLHLLDPVTGTHQFDTPTAEALAIYQQLHQQLPGYLLPRLVREEAGKAGKSLIMTNDKF